MASGSLLPFIYAVLGLYMVDSLIEMSFISSTVWWLHRGSKGPFGVASPDGGGVMQLFGHPENLITDQGHTSNGAGGTAFVLVGLGGIIALWLENSSRKKYHKSSPFFYLWAVIVLLSCLLTLTALIFTFVVTAETSNQTIDLAVVGRLQSPTPYPFLQWTPQTWFGAVADLPLVSDVSRRSIEHYRHIMDGWRWNLIPMFVISLVLFGLVATEVLRTRRNRGSVAYSAAAMGDLESKR